MDDQSPASLALPPPPELFSLTVNQWTEPFWRAAREHRLTAPRCGACGHFRMPPTPFCPKCRSQRIDWVGLSGRGTLYTYTIVTRALIPSMQANVPYVPAIVELPDAGGARLVSNVVGVALTRLRVGAGLQVQWIDRADGVTLPMFTLIDD